MRALLIWVMLCLTPVAAVAQSDDDRGFLTAFLEDNLSDLGRTVRITGFAGALSSRATFDSMTIADADGVWITIRNGAIRWNRSALLQRRIEIEELTADEIDLPRAPKGRDTASRAARDFSLPELPVAVRIGTISAGRVALGADLLGQAAVVSLDGSMQLEGGEGEADLVITRQDGAEGSLTLTAAYANATRALRLDFLAVEGDGGVAASLLGIPGTPALSLAVRAAGPIDDVLAEVSLSSDGKPRLTGQIEFLSSAPQPGAEPARSFRADVSGDIAPLLLPAYREFFGDALSLKAAGRRTPEGQLDLSELVLQSRAIRVSGTAQVLPDGLPQRADLQISLGIDNRTPVLLPIPGAPTTVTGGDLSIGFDAAKGDGWTLDGRLSGLQRSGLALATVRLDGSGRIARTGIGSAAKNGIGGTLAFAAGGIKLDDIGFQSAVGPFLAGKTRFNWQDGGDLQLRALSVVGQGYSAGGDLTVAGFDQDFSIAGRLDARVTGMGRFSSLAGRPLGGSAEVSLMGSGSILTGAFDADLTATGTDLTLAQPEADRLLSGVSRITASVRRDETGTEIRSLAVTASTLKATVSGRLDPDRAELTGQADFSDLSSLGSNYRGSLSATADYSEADGARRLRGTGRGTGLRVGQPGLDRLLAGTSTLAFDVAEEAGAIRINDLRLSNPQASFQAASEGTAGQIAVTARLVNLALFAPDFPGPVTVEGTVAPDSGGWAVDLTGTGPGATSAALTGRVAASGQSVDLAANGTVQAAILNPLLAPRNVAGPVAFDLRMAGQPGLASLTGRVEATGARLIAPNYGIAVGDLNFRADLSGGRADIRATGAVRDGGSVALQGPVDLSAPYSGDLSMTVSRVRLRSPALYDTRVSGGLTIVGPILSGARISGRLDLEETEIRIAATGPGTGSFDGDIRHRRDSAAVRETRARAGLSGGATGAAPGTSRGQSGFPLDITISAPNRIFVRGRGLDAEMGGSLRLTGSTNAILPVGEFNLIRGRLDLLGKRLTIDDGRVQLQGALVPTIRFSASTATDSVTATVLIEGPATSPAISFSSVPDLPEEEVVAQLLFGRGLGTISAFQAAQLASAIATLSGREGAGIIGRLRTSFGLDDLDITSDETGNVALRAGKYISRNAYTELAIGAKGKTEVTLNLDITKDVKLRGSLDSDGQTGLGVFVERDY